MARPLRPVLAALALCAALCSGAWAQEAQLIAAEDFRRLDPDRADGRRYSIAYLKYLKLFRGELNPMTAMMTGRLRVKGNVMLAQRLLGMVDRAKLEAARDEIVRNEQA